MKFGIVGRLISEKMFEKHGYIHIYSPGTGSRQPSEVIFLHLQYYSVNIVLCCKLSSIK